MSRPRRFRQRLSEALATAGDIGAPPAPPYQDEGDGPAWEPTAEQLRRAHRWILDNHKVILPALDQLEQAGPDIYVSGVGVSSKRPGAITGTALLRATWSSREGEESFPQLLEAYSRALFASRIWAAAGIAHERRSDALSNDQFLHTVFRAAQAVLNSRPDVAFWLYQRRHQQQERVEAAISNHITGNQPVAGNKQIRSLWVGAAKPANATSADYQASARLSPRGELVAGQLQLRAFALMEFPYVATLPYQSDAPRAVLDALISYLQDEALSAVWEDGLKDELEVSASQSESGDVDLDWHPERYEFVLPVGELEEALRDELSAEGLSPGDLARIIEELPANLVQEIQHDFPCDGNITGGLELEGCRAELRLRQLGLAKTGLKLSLLVNVEY